MDLAALKQAVVAGDDQQASRLIRLALDEGCSAQSLLNDALIAGMDDTGKLFERGEYFIPEVLLSARAMQTAMDVLRPLLAAGDYEPLGKVIVGTVQSDLQARESS